MKKIALPVLSTILAVLLLFAQTASAIVAAPTDVAVFVGFSLTQIFIGLALFIFIPIAFIGMILRILGFKKEDANKGWHWDTKKALSQFIKYFLYHVGMIGLLFIIIQAVTGQSVIYRNSTYFPYDTYQNTKCANPMIPIHKCVPSWPQDTTQVLPPSPATITLMLAYAIAWAVAGPYMSYFWDKKRNKQTIKPSIWVHARLTVWNIAVLLFVFALINNQDILLKNFWH